MNYDYVFVGADEEPLSPYFLNFYGKCELNTCSCLNQNNGGWRGTWCPNWKPNGSTSWNEMIERIRK